MSTNKYNAILLFGYPGCGKGTQGVTLAGMPNLVHLAMGDIFRSLDKNSPTGKEFMSYASRGMLVPDELTIRVWRELVQDKIDKGLIDPNYHVLILDGIPRTSSQVELMAPIINVLKVIHLKMADQDKLVARLLNRASTSNRPDDSNESVIRNRIKVYEQSTLPVLKCFKDDLVVEINADQNPLSVLRDICDALTDVVPSKI